MSDDEVKPTNDEIDEARAKWVRNAQEAKYSGKPENQERRESSFGAWMDLLWRALGLTGKRKH